MASINKKFEGKVKFEDFGWGKETACQLAGGEQVVEFIHGSVRKPWTLPFVSCKSYGNLGNPPSSNTKLFTLADGRYFLEIWEGRSKDWGGEDFYSGTIFLTPDQVEFV